MSRKTRVSYSAIAGYLQTGDIVLCSGDTIFSRIVRRVTRSEWSHCGMIIRTEDTDELLFWESTTPNTMADVEAGRPLDGVQLVPLRERLQSYPGHVAVRRLHAARTTEILQALHDFRLEVKGRGFDRDVGELLRSALDDDDWRIDDNVEDLSRFFCSELLAETYQRMGLLPPDPPSNEYTPKDFSTEVNGKLLLPDHVYLSAEQLVEPD